MVRGATSDNDDDAEQQRQQQQQPSLTSRVCVCVCVCVQPRVQVHSWSDPQVPSGHLQTMLPRVRKRHRIQKGKHTAARTRAQQEQLAKSMQQIAGVDDDATDDARRHDDCAFADRRAPPVAVACVVCVCSSAKCIAGAGLHPARHELRRVEDAMITPRSAHAGTTDAADASRERIALGRLDACMLIRSHTHSDAAGPFN